MGARFAFLVASAAWCGLALAPSLGTRAALLLAGAGVVLGLARGAGSGRLALAFLLLGLARGGTASARHERFTAAFTASDATWRLTAIVDEPPRRGSEEPLATIRVLAASPPLPRDTRVRVRLPPDSRAEWGDTLAGVARLAALPGRRVPGGHDASASARAAGVAASGRMFAASVRPARTWSTAPFRGAMRVRRAGEEALARGLSPRARELAEPLLFGDRGGMGSDTDAMLRASGLVHLLALSGLHVTWVAGAARLLVALALGGVRARAVAGALAALAYALVAGPIPSLARAVAAEALATLATWREQALDPLQSLGLAAVLLLAWQPAWAHDLGFQLSCVATFGLVAIGGPLAKLAARPGPRLRGARGLALRALRALAGAIALTFGAQLAVLPWLMALFHAIPWAALAGNLVAVPLSEGLLAAAALGAGAECVLPGAGRVWLAASEPLALALHDVVGVLGGSTASLLATGGSAWCVAGAALAAVLLGLGLDPPRTLERRVAADTARALARACGATALALTALLLATTRPLLPERGAWWVVAIDVGQGDATAIASADGWWLVDTGPRSPRWDAGESAVLPFLRWAGVRRLERVILTHDDGDHTGGFAALRRGIAFAQAFGPAPRAGVPGPCARLGLGALTRGDTLPGTPHARVLWPPRDRDDSAGLARRGDNASSVVLELGDADARVLLTADADSLVERALDAVPRPALLHAGHHGSGSSSGALALARIEPRRIVVSCGARNPYGHPHAGALARLGAHGAAIDRTDRAGTLWYACSSTGCRRLDWHANEPRQSPVRQSPAAGRVGAACEY
jgi:competence protein ComEC